jgi:hypothetical protein
MKLNQYPSSESQVVPYGQTDIRADERTDMKKIIVAFRDFANAPKNEVYNEMHGAAADICKC